MGSDSPRRRDRTEVATRSAFRRRTGVESVAIGWCAGMLFWGLVAVVHAQLPMSRPLEFLRLATTGLLLFGSFQLVLMVPGIAAFGLWHMHAPDRLVHSRSALLLGPLVGAGAAVLWRLPYKSEITLSGLMTATPSYWGAAIIVGLATFLAGARARRIEADAARAARERRSDGAAST